jgi:DNA-binding LytR/AlgR family response regulator
MQFKAEKWHFGREFRHDSKTRLSKNKGGLTIENMKITINTDEKYTETEIAINCRDMGDDIEKLLAAIRLLDMKLTGRKDGRQYTLEAADVLFIESTDKRTFLYTLTDVYESPFKLYELEAKLADREFLRASKNCIVNLTRIQSIEPDIDRRLTLTMERDLKVVVSRQYSPLVKEKLGGHHG